MYLKNNNIVILICTWKTLWVFVLHLSRGMNWDENLIGCITRHFIIYLFFERHELWGRDFTHASRVALSVSKFEEGNFVHQTFTSRINLRKDRSTYRVGKSIATLRTVGAEGFDFGCNFLTSIITRNDQGNVLCRRWTLLLIVALRFQSLLPLHFSLTRIINDKNDDFFN